MHTNATHTHTHSHLHSLQQPWRKHARKSLFNIQEGKPTGQPASVRILLPKPREAMADCLTALLAGLLTGCLTDLSGIKEFPSNLCAAGIIQRQTTVIQVV